MKNYIETKKIYAMKMYKQSGEDFYPDIAVHKRDSLKVKQ